MNDNSREMFPQATFFRKLVGHYYAFKHKFVEK